jgi:hypothetical protein
MVVWAIEASFFKLVPLGKTWYVVAKEQEARVMSAMDRRLNKKDIRNPFEGGKYKKLIYATITYLFNDRHPTPLRSALAQAESPFRRRHETWSTERALPEQ